jgi:SWI/SNF-related matrix-associated actin-dependent regulator of chromatin subfamily A member 5
VHVLNHGLARRVKSEVETSLKPKIQYVLKVPLSALQRRWYRRFMEKEADGLVTKTQIISVMSQLQKTINHPKCIFVDLERKRKAAQSLVQKAEGAEFFTIPEVLREKSDSAKLLEAELAELKGRSLVEGKLTRIRLFAVTGRCTDSDLLPITQPAVSCRCSTGS